MKEYTYCLFMRHPETTEIQHGTITITHDGYLDVHSLMRYLSTCKELVSGYTLLGMQVVTVEDIL